jgi:putative ABC transport system substrate-binding protein
MVFAGEAGLIESLARPGGNVTGTTSYPPVGKAVGLLRELVPASSRLAVLVVSSNIGTPSTVRQAQLAATSLGMDLTVVGVERVEPAAPFVRAADMTGCILSAPPELA